MVEKRPCKGQCAVLCYRWLLWRGHRVPGVQRRAQSFAVCGPRPCSSPLHPCPVLTSHEQPQPAVSCFQDLRCMAALRGLASVAASDAKRSYSLAERVTSMPLTTCLCGAGCEARRAQGASLDQA